MRSLLQCLIDLEPAHLRAIARFWDIVPQARQSRQIAGELAVAMADGAAIATAWVALPSVERAAAEALLVAGGQLPSRAFSRRWGEPRPMGPGRMEREEPWRGLVSPAEGLWYRGFIFREFEQTATGLIEMTFVPAELSPHLPIPPAPLEARPLEEVPEPEHVTAGDGLLDDACTLLVLLQTEQVPTTAPGSWVLPPRQSVWRSADPARLALLRQLSDDLHWVRQSHSGHLRPEPGPVAAWLRASASNQRAALAEAWRESVAWNDLHHVLTLVREDTGAWRNDPRLARRTVLHWLAGCVPGVWYSTDSFVAAIKQCDPDFQRPDGDYGTWYIRDAATGAYLSGFESWDAVEGALIRYILHGPLAWLGLTEAGVRDTAASQDAAFRLTVAGAAFLGLAELPPESGAGRLELHADFTVTVPPGRRFERFQLARAADRVGVGERFIYRLTPGSLERARRQGITVHRVLEFLADAAGGSVHHSVQAALARWDTSGTEARLERPVLLRLATEDLMNEAALSPTLREVILERVGPTVAIVRAADLQRVVEALGELGLLPDLAGLNDEE